MVQTPIPAAPSTTNRKELIPGALCWAKLSRYPWWPALILERTDSRIPPQEKRSTNSATPVLFFGTAEFSWIDSTRNVSPWETEHDTRSAKDDSPDFELALSEAQEYADECRLPTAFAPEILNQISSAPEPGGPYGEGYEPGLPPHIPLGTEKRPVPLLAAHELDWQSAPRRKTAVQRQLGLAPPWNSPYKNAVAHNAALAAAMQGQAGNVAVAQ